MEEGTTKASQMGQSRIPLHGLLVVHMEEEGPGWEFGLRQEIEGTLMVSPRVGKHQRYMSAEVRILPGVERGQEIQEVEEVSVEPQALEAK